jgi:non-canonical (house-cleaning) NTP pyrophosphatase
MKILAGSSNPVKIASVETEFNIYFNEVDVTGIINN